MDEKLQQIDRFVFDKMKQSHLPGLSLAIIQGDDVIHARGFGQRDLQKGLPATAKTLYGIGSITKSFTCLSVMQLQMEGHLNVDDPVGKYLKFDVQPYGEPVTIRHLMTHSSGIPALAYAEAVIRKGAGDGGQGVPIGDVQDMITFMSDCDEWVHAPPGERWFYLNEGYVLLGGIIESVSGLSYDEYVTQHILKPLGMGRTYFHKDDVESDPHAAQPYVVDRDGNRHPENYLYGSITSDGGIISNVRDMVRYIRMYLNKGRIDDRQIIDEDSADEMMKPRIDTPSTHLYSRGAEQDELVVDFDLQVAPRKYGYGLGINPDFFGRRMVGHGGSVLISTGQMAFMPDEGWGVMLLANGSGYSLSNLAQYALAVLMGEDPDELAFRRSEVLLKEFEGIYEAYQGNYRGKLRRLGDLLQFETSSRFFSQKVPLIPQRISPGGTSEFFTIRGGQRLPVHLHKREDGAHELIFERYKMKKTSQLGT